MDHSNHEEGLSAQDKEMAKKDGYVEKSNQPFFWQKRKLQVTVNGWHYCCAFALSAVLSGQFVGGNPGLAAGVGGFIVCLILISTAYILFSSCIGELASAIPFCGGSYGYTRFVFGKLPGYIIGIIEFVEYFLLITTNGFFAGNLVCLITGTHERFLPLWWFIIYGISCSLQLRGGKLMWTVVNVICVITMVILVIFFLGTTKWMDISKNGSLPGPDPWFTTDASIFFQAFPFAIWMFIGVEVTPMISEEVEEPHKNVPKGIKSAVWILAICSIFSVLNVASLPPPNNGTLLDTAVAPFPLQKGWSLIFGKDSNLSVLLSFLPIFNVVYGTGIGASRQMFAMSRSGYLPSFLSLTSENGIPYVTSTLISISCFILSLIVQYTSPTRFWNCLWNVLTITGISNYIVQLSCFIVWRYKYTTITRQYWSPYGVPGAVLAICIFGLGLGSMFAFIPHITDAVIAIIVFLTIAIIYYFVYARHHLTLSPEEIHSLFPVYSFMVLREKWKKTHKQQKRKDSIDSSKGLSTARSYIFRTKVPVAEVAVELEPMNESQKDVSIKDVSNKDVSHNTDVSVSNKDVSDQSNVQLFNPFLLGSVRESQPEYEMSLSGHVDLTSPDSYQSEKLSQLNQEFESRSMPEALKTVVSVETNV